MAFGSRSLALASTRFTAFSLTSLYSLILSACWRMLSWSSLGNVRDVLPLVPLQHVHQALSFVHHPVDILLFPDLGRHHDLQHDLEPTHRRHGVEPVHESSPHLQAVLAHQSGNRQRRAPASGGSACCTPSWSRSCRCLSATLRSCLQ